MKAEDVIREVKEDLAEWIEMSDDPAAFLAGVLANRIIRLENYIEYLERRIEHADTR